MKLAIFTTGGTLDKIYFDAKDDYEVGDPTVIEILKQGRFFDEPPVIQVLRKDSLDITEDDRQLICDAVRNHPATHCLVTHGTDTIVKTAKLLASIKGKVIVLTGASQPTRFKDTDAYFNVGCALGVLSAARPGVYIVMNGRMFDPERTKKNLETGRFEEV